MQTQNPKKPWTLNFSEMYICISIASVELKPPQSLNVNGGDGRFLVLLVVCKDAGLGVC
jgi:hypothetical protein